MCTDQLWGKKTFVSLYYLLSQVKLPLFNFEANPTLHLQVICASLYSISIVGGCMISH